MTISKALLYKFAGLFSGNQRSHGVWDKATGKMRTEHSAAAVDDYKMHLTGEQGVGVVPIMDDGTSHFAVIDIDNHGQTEDTDIAAVAKAISDRGYPLIPCRSKSGGVHCYIFFSAPIPSHKARAVLAAMAPNVGHPHAEIFPKQDRLMDDKDSGEKALGNWINLCYFDSDGGNRRAITSTGRVMTLDEFVEVAEAKKVSEVDVDNLLSSGHVEAPPCIQRFFNEGVPSGYRNQALYNIVIYLRRSRPDTFIDDAMDVNNQIFDRPLPAVEAKRTIKSASRRDYKYKCGEEPCKAYCDSRTCVTRLYGITPDEASDIRNADAMPEFTNLTKYDTDPPRWGFNMGDKRIEGVDTEELFNFNSLRKAVAAKLNVYIPAMSSRRWDALLSVMFQSTTTVDVPRDASAAGQAVERLCEYLSKADARLSEGYDEAKERDKLTRGMPCIQFMDLEGGNVKCGVFKMTDFVKHLKNTRSEDLKGANLYFALREQLGVDTKRIRVGPASKPTTIWYVPMANLNRMDAVPPDFKPEF